MDTKEPAKRRRIILSIVLVLVVVLVTIAVLWLVMPHASKTTKVATKAAATKATTTAKATTTTTQVATTGPGLNLDPSKDYGNKYQDGLLPVGDNHYVTDAAKQGYVYACSSYAASFSMDHGGAGSRGPWFTNNNTEYDVTKKLHVQGSVTWPAQFTITLANGTRTIVTNDLPNHLTGVFPIQTTDPAYVYDRNPNTISAQSLTYALNASPTYGDPQCMGGEVGIMLTGVALFSAFDAGGRDAGAWEVQDSCDGHPQNEGEYHYHTLSACIKDTSVHTVIGYALDGFPITGPQVGTNNVLTTSDLDECHGITSTITVDGKDVVSYHYVMTEDFPYSVSCFRATPIQSPQMKH